MNFWEARWLNGQTGWHNKTVNEHLQRHQSVLMTVDNPTVLVPLCGKSLDLAWLKSLGSTVIGVDLVRKPLEDFFTEQGIIPTIEKYNGIEAFKVHRQTLLHANIFDVNSETIGLVDAIYDRAALVALPPEQREAYAEHCWSLLKPGGSILLLTYDAPVAEDKGPPFPVRRGVIEQLFTKATECIQIDEIILTKENSERLRKRDLEWSRSDIWKITK